jgi:hypothetical protein
MTKAELRITVLLLALLLGAAATMRVFHVADWLDLLWFVRR